MKIAIVSSSKLSAQYVLNPLKEPLGVLGVEVTYFDGAEEPTTNFYKYDLVHAASVGMLGRWYPNCAAPITVNMWTMPEDKDAAQVHDMCQMFNIARIITYSASVVRAYAMQGYYKVSHAPITFDHTQFSLAAPPARPFSVGMFCSDHPAKRVVVDEVRRGCEIAGVEFDPTVYGATDTTYNNSPQDVYARTHVHCNASLSDIDSLPVHEALLVGRPFVSIRSEGVEKVAKEGVHGVYFDGTAEDFARQVAHVRDRYKFYYLAAPSAETNMVSPMDAASAYLKAWNRTLEEL